MFELIFGYNRQNGYSHVIYCRLAVEIGFQVIVKPSMGYDWLCSQHFFSEAPLIPVSENRHWHSLSGCFQFGLDAPGLILVIIPSHFD